MYIAFKKTASQLYLDSFPDPASYILDGVTVYVFGQVCDPEEVAIDIESMGFGEDGLTEAELDTEFNNCSNNIAIQLSRSQGKHLFKPPEIIE